MWTQSGMKGDRLDIRCGGILWTRGKVNTRSNAILKITLPRQGSAAKSCDRRNRRTMKRIALQCDCLLGTVLRTNTGSRVAEKGMA